MTTSRARQLPVPVLVSFALLAIMVLVSLGLAIKLTQNTQALVGVSEYRRATTDVISAMRDAETGQRGYLLTGDKAYLAPYRANLASIEPILSRIASHGARGQRVSESLRPLLTAKMAELKSTIDAEAAGHHDVAIRIVATNRGKYFMDQIRDIAEHERAWGIATSISINQDSSRIIAWLTVGLVLGAASVVLLSLLWLSQTRRQFAQVDTARADAEAALIALKTEVDAREAAEGQLRQLQKIESLGQLTGGIAHDFNNMLAVVMGGIELARRKLTSDPERVDSLLEGAREGAARAATLTARLLAFSRNQPLAPAPLDVNKLVGGMCDMLHRTLGEAVEVECIYGAGLWRCYADPSEVENAILNLSINARDAMPTGGKLTVETANAHIDDHYARSRADVVAGQYVLLCVTDTGSGMSEDVVERAFDPFFTTKPVGKGTGLGLSQVFGFVKQSGGHVAIYSEVGQGTAVKMYLPRFLGSDSPLAQTSPPHEMPQGNAAETILVVEDEQRVRHFAVDALHELGYTVIAASSPAEALQLLREHSGIVLLFTDIVMPEMTGRQLADEARVLNPDLKVLFTTGYTRNAVVHNGMIDVGVAFLSKPYSMAEMARKVRDVIDGRGVNRLI